jgi:phage terminase large subunit-like protein
MSSMVKALRLDSPAVAKAIKNPNTRRIYSAPSDSFIVALSKDADGSEGVNVHCAINDEVHTHPDGKQIENIESAMVARSQPLSFNITTAGRSIGSFCYKLRETCIQVLKNIKQDDSLFTLIYGLDEGDDWENPKIWRKANPSINIPGGIDDYALQVEYQKAKNEGISKENYFKTRHLNLWITSHTNWIKDEHFKLLHKPQLDIKNSAKRLAFAGLDLSSNSDLSAFVTIVPPKKAGKPIKVFTKFYLPKDNITTLEAKHKAPYQQWEREGLITLTPGDSIDYSFIEKDIKEVADLLDLQALGFDRKYATTIIANLKDYGILTNPIAQNTATMNAAIIEIERIVKHLGINYDSVVLRWMMSEVSLYVDTDFCKKVDRRTSGKVDGIVALLMAFLQYLVYLHEHPEEKAYLESGLTFV